MLMLLMVLMMLLLVVLLMVLLSMSIAASAPSFAFERVQKLDLQQTSFDFLFFFFLKND